MMNSLSEIQEAIEQGDIYADALLASTTETLLRRYKRNPQVAYILAELGKTPSLAPSLIARLEELYNVTAPPGYQSPTDLAICGYLYLLYSRSPHAIYSFLRRFSQEKRDDLPISSRLADAIIVAQPLPNETTPELAGVA